MATFYVAIFSSLAIAYTAMSGINSEIAGNARREQLSLATSESGLSVMRYYLSQLSVPASTTSDQLFTTLGTHLSSAFNGTLNLNGQRVTASTSLIHVPPVAIDTTKPGATFEADITRTGSNYTVKVTGHYGGVDRAVQVIFAEKLGPPDNSIMDNGIVSRGSVRFNGSVTLKTNAPGGCGVMALDPSADPPIHVSGSSQLQSDFYMAKEFVDPSDIFGGSASWGPPGGTSFPDSNADAHIHTGVEPPAWPTVDTSAFDSLINTLPHTTINSTTNLNSSMSVHNVYIAPNTNPNFKGSLTVSGLVYIAWPNQVNFSGSVNVTGMIICQPPPYEPSMYMLPNCSMVFNGSVNSSGPENLPDTSEYAGLRDKLGTFLIGKDYSVRFNGSACTVNGSIYTSMLRFNGSTSGTIRGSMLADRQYVLQDNGSVDLTFQVDPNSQAPSGLIFGQDKTLALEPGSYQEL